ncbi:PspA/IM30 family protein [Specibacter cremeus]|uniref:PspA/IM30 family protein n=1 Tax=Specibacter cremeus TaxID=1629051 RepID=UPI000F775A3A|nr:hypothetical protein [Specibacter cremeus]
MSIWRKRAKKEPEGLGVAESLDKQLAALAKMRRGVADVATSRQRLDLQATELERLIAELKDQAATAAEDDGLARAARSRAAVMTDQLADITAQRDALVDQETMLKAELAQLQTRVDGFGVTAQTLAARRQAADAHRRIGESLRDLADGPD